MGVAFGTCGEKRNAYWNLVRNLNDGNTLKTRRVWADNIKMDLNDIEGKNVDWVCVVQDKKKMEGCFEDDTELSDSIKCR